MTIRPGPDEAPPISLKDQADVLRARLVQAAHAALPLGVSKEDGRWLFEMILFAVQVKEGHFRSSDDNEIRKLAKDVEERIIPEALAIVVKRAEKLLAERAE